jgi:sec-independent protein translocase protein TatC
VVFELPVLIFFLTLIRVASPSFLIRHSRYAILAIVILAAVITPSPDALNMTLFAVPMILLYFLGVFVSYLLVLRREGRKFPWKVFSIWLAAVLIVAGIGMAYARYWRVLIK